MATNIIAKNMKDSIIDILSIIVLAAVLVLNILFRNQFNGGIFLFIISILIIFFGIIIWIIGKATLGEYFTTSVHPKGLVTKGIYSKFKHPMYYSGMIIYLGVALLLKSWVGLGLTIAIIIPMLFYFAKKEEGLLYERYREKYSAYKEKTII